MNPTKRFLLIFFGVALVGWIGGNVLLGPPGYTRAYLDENHQNHEHYIEITKHGYYKLYQQRPALHPVDGPDAPAHFDEWVAFVEEYESNPAFHEELHRMHLYELFFDFWNAGLLVVLVWHFGRKPLLKFLDNSITELRERVEAAAHARKSAEERRRKAEAQMAQLNEEQARVAEETQARIERELAQLEEANELSLKTVGQELADRKARVYQGAEQRVKRELLNRALARLEKTYLEGYDSTLESAQFDRFIEGLEKGA